MSSTGPRSPSSRRGRERFRGYLATAIVVVLALGFLVALVTVGPLSGSERPTRCEWDDARTALHEDVAAAGSAAIALALESPIAPEVEVGRIRTFTSDREVQADMGTCLRSVVGSTSVRALVNEFSSWELLDYYVDESSIVASVAAEYEQAQARSSFGASREFALRLEQVDGNARADLYCTDAAGSSSCRGWNILYRSSTCRALLVDLELTGPQLVAGDAARILLPLAKQGLAAAEAEAEAFPCSDYGDEPTRHRFAPR